MIKNTFVSTVTCITYCIARNKIQALFPYRHVVHFQLIPGWIFQGHDTDSERLQPLRQLLAVSDIVCNAKL